MTGNPNRKTRVYLSQRLYSPLAQRKDFDQAIAEFKKAVSTSMSQSRLNADIAVKAMPATQGNTDGKKRTNTGQIPGVVDIDGIRFKPNEKGGEGKVFKWIPSIHDRMNPSKNNVNFGWMSPSDLSKGAQGRAKPEVRVRKYRINPKTNEPIEGSEQRINPYNLASDQPLEKGLEFKKLPGRRILDSVPGGTLAGRAAAKFGIWIDEFNKMRCPPGTPAANQFTDATGSNCFGISPSGLINIAQEIIKRSDLEVLDQISNRLAAKDPSRSGLSSGRVQNDPWWKKHWGAQRSKRQAMAEGYKLDLNPRKISVAEQPTQFRWFVTGAKRAQNGMVSSQKRVGKLLDTLGVEATPEEMATNAHLFRAIDELNNRGMLELKIGAPLGFDGIAGERPSYEKVRRMVEQKLRNTSPDAWNALSDAQKEKIIQADVERYYEIERQMIEAFLDAYIQMPEHFKNIKFISYAEINRDEAEAFSLGGDNFEHSMIKIDPLQIMENQEKMLPSMDEYHKLRIDAINGSDAENAQELTDFLVSANIEARRTAAMAMGHEAFARHIMYHEIGHTLQIAAVGRKLKELGYDDPDNEKIADVITDQLKAGNFIEDWFGGLSKTEAVKFLAGSYPSVTERVQGRTLGLIEAQAELFALRMSGLIWGDDIDNALGYMDDIADGRFAEDRLGFQEMEQSVFDAAAVGNVREPIYPMYAMTLDDARRRKLDEQKKYLDKEIGEIKTKSDDDFVDGLINAEADVLNSEILVSTAAYGDGMAAFYQKELEYKKKVYDEYLKESRRRFGTNAEGKRKLKEKIRDRKDSRGIKLSDSENQEKLDAEEKLRKSHQEKSIKEISDNASSMTDDELADAVVLAEQDAKEAAQIAKETPESLNNGKDKKEWEQEAELQEKIAKAYRDEAKKRFGDDASGRKNFEKKKRDSREKRNLLSQEEATKISEERRLKQIDDNAKNDDEDTLIQRLADIEAELADPSITDSRKEQLNSEKKKYRQAIREKRKTSGDDSNPQRISKYIDKEVDKKLEESGRKQELKKKSKNIRSGKDAEEHAMSERSRLLERATPKERDAITQMADPNVVDVGQLLNPESHVRAAKAINKRNRRATRNGNEVDETSREVGSLAGQVEHILIPSLDLIDKSELDETVEIETELELDPKQLKGAKDADDIVVDSLIRGRVITNSKPFSGGTEDKSPEVGGKTKTKVVVRAQKGQKGYYPHWSDETSSKPKDYEQQMVMPSGKLRIVERRIDKNGNEVLVAEVVQQNDAMRSLTSMIDSIGVEGPEPTQHAKGTRKKLEKVVNAYAAKRAREGRYASTVTPEAKAEKIKKRTDDVSADIKDAGGDGPSGMSKERSSEAKSAVSAHSTDSIFGKVEPREDRTQNREAKQMFVISALRDLITFGGSDSDIEIDESDITPEVRDLIENSTDQELLGIISQQSQRFHETVDKRPRLRFWDDQLQKFLDKPRNGSKSPEAVDDEEESISLGQKLRDALSALDTPETRDLLANIGKTVGKRAARDELQYMVEDGTLDEETADKLSEILDGLIPDSEAEIDPALVVAAVKSVLEKRKAESRLRGLSSGALATTAQSLIQAWDTWNAADPDNLALTQDLATNVAMMTGSDVTTAADLVAKLVKKMKRGSAVSEYGESKPYDFARAKQVQDVMKISMLLYGAKYKDAQEWAKKQMSSLSSSLRTRREKRRGIEVGGKQYSASGEEIFRTQSIDEALQLISEGKLVELDSVERVATMIDKLNEIIKDAKERGENAPNYDLCKVSVPGTNLFCSESKGIPRIQMPQFSGEPVPGTRADKLEKNKSGQVDGTAEFEKHLESLGVAVERRTVKASELKATQNELVGSKVVGMINNPSFDPAGEEIFVSRDGYVIDGHHRWAAQVGRDLADGQIGDLDLKVRVVDMPISEILREANNWASDFGIAAKSGKGNDEAKPQTRELVGGAQLPKQKEKPALPEMEKAATRYGATPAGGQEPRSPGLKANRDRSVREYGMEWKPEYTDNQTVETAKEWDGWDSVETTSIDLAENILPTESHLKGSSIDKVVSGEEPFREGYDPHLLIDENGQIFVIDGHNRVAMHRALGNSKMTAKIIDLRNQDAPWDSEKQTRREGLSSGKKNYGGYELEEPDNPEPKPGEYPDDVVEAARSHRDEIAEVEKEMTETLIDLANQHGGKMEGLAFRLKSLKSLARKIFAEKDDEHGGDADAAAKSMSDVVRYTMTYNPDGYVDGVSAVVKDLQDKGYKLRIKNYWEGGDPYQGINVAAEHPSGVKFELQFHTPQSVTDKEEIHKVYEDYRTEKDVRKRYKLYDSMVRMAKKIEVPYPPDELLEIGTKKYQPFTTKNNQQLIERKVLVGNLSGENLND